MPPLPHFRNHSHFVAPDINIESEHKVQAKYNFLIQNKVLPVCVWGVGWGWEMGRVSRSLTNSLLEGSRGKEPGPGFLPKSVMLLGDASQGGS